MTKVLKKCFKYPLIIYKNYQYTRLLKNKERMYIYLHTIEINCYTFGSKCFNNIPNYLKNIYCSYSTFYEYKYLPSSITKLILNEKLRTGIVATDDFWNANRRKIKISNLPNKVKYIKLENVTVVKLYVNSNKTMINYDRCFVHRTIKIKPKNIIDNYDFESSTQYNNNGIIPNLRRDYYLTSYSS
jgi:hypothetical protein